MADIVVRVESFPRLSLSVPRSLWIALTLTMSCRSIPLILWRIMQDPDTLLRRLSGLLILTVLCDWSAEDPIGPQKFEEERRKVRAVGTC